ncbi:MAG: cupin domain-containing protein [Sneathiella sp.]
MDNPGQQIAKNIKWFRAERGWSLDRTASETGVSKAMLGQIERGESSPTVATLWKIVKGFSISLSSLVEERPEKADLPVTVFRDAHEIRKKIAEDGMMISPLFPYDPRVDFEYFEMTFPPGYDRLAAPHKKGVIEYITVIDGELEVLSEERWYCLKKGQSLRFEADRPHGYRNLKGKPAVALNVINYPRG